MQSKLAILFALASLSHCAYVPTSKADFGLSKKQVKVLHSIMVSQERTVAACFDAFTTLFDVLFDQKVTANERSSEINKALNKVKRAMNTTLDPDVLALGERCSAKVEVARKLAHADFDDAFARISAALKLAGLGNFPENRAGIEAHHQAARKDYKNLVEIDWNVIYDCLHTNDPDILAAIENARKESLRSALHLINAVFNAVKIYAATVPVPCGAVTFIFDIQDLKVKVFANVQAYVEYKFGTLRALYIYSCLNQPRIVTGVVLSQYTEIVSILEYIAANNGVFDVARGYLKRLDLGLNNDFDGNAYTSVNASAARIVTQYGLGDNAILDLILFIHPDLSVQITAAREVLHLVDVGGYDAFVEAFDLAVSRGKSHSEILAAIAALSNATVSPSGYYTNYVFNLIRDNRTFAPPETEAELNHLEKVATDGLAVNTLKCFEAAVVLADAAHAGTVTKKHYRAIGKLQDEANEACDGFTQGITAACLLVYRNMVAAG